jgi:hypothetical protein
VDISGNVIVTGFSQKFPNSDYDYYTAKYAAADGALLWERRYDGPSHADSPGGLAIDAEGNVAVTGSSAGDYATSVYWENLPPVSVQKVPIGMRISFSGIAGRVYDVQRAPTLTGPWSTISTQAAPASGIFDYVDSTQILGTTFYRTRTQ